MLFSMNLVMTLELHTRPHDLIRTLYFDLVIVVAIELMAACQALEFRRPLTTTKPLEAVYTLVRSVVKLVIIYYYIYENVFIT